MANDKIAIDFNTPNFVKGEMPTSTKLNKVGNNFAKASDEILEVLGNTYAYGIPTIAGILGNFLDTSTLSPAVPYIYSAGGFDNKIPVSISVDPTDKTRKTITLGTIGGVQQQVSLAPHTYTTIANGTYVPLFNIALVAVDISGEVVAKFECNFTSTTTNNLVAPLTQIRCISTDTDLDNAIDTVPHSINGVRVSFYLLCSNQNINDTLKQTEANIGSLKYASTAGMILGKDDTIVKVTDASGFNIDLTSEISRLEDKSFWVYWRVDLNTDHMLNPAPSSMSVSGQSDYQVRSDIYSWAMQDSGTSYWEATSNPSAALAIAYTTLAAVDPSVSFPVYSTDLNSDAFATGATEAAKELATPNPLRCPIYYKGVPVLRATGQRATAYMCPSNNTIYVLKTDLQGAIGVTFSVFVPVLIPLRLLRSTDFVNRQMIDTWNGLMYNVIGSQYYGGTIPMPSSIAHRLDVIESNMTILRDAITALTTYRYSSAWVS